MEKMIDGVVYQMTPEEEAAWIAMQTQMALPRLQDYEQGIAQYLNTTAAERQYDGIAVGASYRDSPNAVYAEEGEAMHQFRSDVWEAAEPILAQVKAGTLSPLPSVQAFIDTLPKITWPVVGSGGGGPKV